MIGRQDAGSSYGPSKLSIPSKEERRVMANIKSAEKRIRQTVRKQAKNKSVRTRLKSALKTHRGTEPASQAEKLSGTFSEIDIARKKGVIHKNAAARYKSRLAKKANAKG